MSTGVSDSQFYMWRAIFAIAHADGKVTQEEEDFMDKYLEKVPFSLKQKAILEDDITHPKNAGEMLARVTDPEDQGTFFQFARMMVWSDGNYDAQEKEIMGRLLGAHMEQLDMPVMQQALEKTRGDQKLKALQEEEYVEDHVQKSVGFGAIISRIFGKVDPRLHDGEEMDESRFFMWRAIFAMAHADDEITPEEQKFMLEVLNTEELSAAQRVTLERDMEVKQDVAEMFKNITSQDDRSAFFHFARVMCWCDGNFDAQEQEIMVRLKSEHVKSVDFDKIESTLKIDDDHAEKIRSEVEAAKVDPKDTTPLISFLHKFRSGY